MNNEERKEVFSQYPTNQMVEIESPNVDKTKEKQDKKMISPTRNLPIWVVEI
jgi:hypothetical protein